MRFVQGPYRVVQVEDPRMLEEIIVALEVEYRSERQEVERKYERLESLSGMIAEHRRRLVDLRGKIA